MPYTGWGRTHARAHVHAQPRAELRADDQGFDDMFDDSIFRTTLGNSRLAQPRMWPLSVSRLRQYTTYGGQGMPANHDTSHSTFMTHYAKGVRAYPDSRRLSWRGWR